MLTKLSLFAAVSALSLNTSPEDVQSAVSNADAAMEKLNDDLVKLSSSESEDSADAEAQDSFDSEDSVDADSTDDENGMKVTFKGKVLDMTAADEVVEAYTDEEIDALMGYSDANPNGIEFQDDEEEAMMTETERADLEDADEDAEIENPFLVYGGMEEDMESEDSSEASAEDSTEDSAEDSSEEASEDSDAEEADDGEGEGDELAPAEEDQDMLSLAKSAGKEKAVAFLSNTKLGLPRRRHRWAHGGNCRGGIRSQPGRGDLDDCTSQATCPAGYTIKLCTMRGRGDGTYHGWMKLGRGRRAICRARGSWLSRRIGHRVRARALCVSMRYRKHPRRVVSGRTSQNRVARVTCPRGYRAMGCMCHSWWMRCRRPGNFRRRNARTCIQRMNRGGHWGTIEAACAKVNRSRRTVRRRPRTIRRFNKRKPSRRARKANSRKHWKGGRRGGRRGGRNPLDEMERTLNRVDRSLRSMERQLKSIQRKR
jgi:hypothetical protein